MSEFSTPLTCHELNPTYITGYNGNRGSNLVWHPSEGWFAYGDRNRVIVEKISDKTQRVFYPFGDAEVGAIELSTDKNYLAVAA